MKTIVSGCRDGVTYGDIKIAISGLDITTVLSAGARGSDLFGEQWAKERKIPIQKFHVLFSKENPYAEQIGLDDMVFNAEAAVILVNGTSVRANYLKDKCLLAKIPVRIHHVEPSPIVFVEKEPEKIDKVKGIKKSLQKKKTVL